MLDRPRTKTDIDRDTDRDRDIEEEEEEDDEELPSYLREQSSDEEDAALYSKNKRKGVRALSVHCPCPLCSY